MWVGIGVALAVLWLLVCVAVVCICYRGVAKDDRLEQRADRSPHVAHGEAGAFDGEAAAAPVNPIERWLQEAAPPLSTPLPPPPPPPSVFPAAGRFRAVALAVLALARFQRRPSRGEGTVAKATQYFEV